MRIAGLLLAAGRSTRFGADDKLAALLAGRPLLDHAADALRATPLAMRLVVRPEGAADLPGLEKVHVGPGLAMARSLAAGIAAARAAGAEAALVALADMPFVTPDHLRALVEACEGPAALIASTDGERPSPPALFGSDWFAALEAGEGDAGGRALIAKARLIQAPPASLRDIDTLDDLAALHG